MSWAEGLYLLFKQFESWHSNVDMEKVSADIVRSSNQRPASSAADQSEASNQSEWAPEFGLCETPPPGPNSGQCQYFNGSEDKEKLTDVL